MTRVRVGAFVLVLFAALALLAPILAPIDPSQSIDVVATRFLSPGTLDGYGTLHLLGTDRLGRDVWSRLLFGAQISLLVAALATAVALGLGALVGTLAASSRGSLRTLLLGMTDISLAVPRVAVLLLLAALWQPSTWLVVITLGLTGWMPIARLVYAEATIHLARPYAETATALGSSRRHVIVRHILPHAAGPILAAVTLGVGNAITLEAGLSFLGVGVQPPRASWGSLIASGRDTVVNAPWVGLAPGLALVLVVIACTLVADGLEPGQRPV
jgi:peptide/nickel transport system permease protein